MNKFIWVLLLFFGLAGSNLAQTDGLTNLSTFDPGYSDLETECPPPIIDALSIIHYRDYVKVYLELKGTNAAFISLQLAGDRGIPAQVPIDGGKVLLENLLPNQQYYLSTLDNCGKATAPMLIDTKTEREEVITVSTNFYNGIVGYLKENKGIPFDEFMASLENVSPYEKTAFIQQFFNAGEPYLTDAGETVPSIPPEDGGGEPTSCACSSIRTSPLALPSVMNAVTGTITDFSSPSSGITPTSIDGGDNTRTWHFINNKGAAKWHNLYTEGYKSEKNVNYDVLMGWQDGSLISFQQSQLRMTFLCLDGGRLPKECECEKNVDFWYRYDTRVKAIAELRHGTTGAKNSIAQTEDMALATFMEELNPASFDPLNMVFGRVESYCERTPNPAFWTNLAQLMGSVGTISLAIAGVSQTSIITPQQLSEISTQLQTFFTGLSTVINTPYQNPTDCDNVEELPYSMSGAFTKPLKPNTPIIMAINTFDKLYAGGCRAWHSQSRINSDFHITAVIHSNAYDGTPRHCCSPRVGAWIFGSCDGDRTTSQLNIEVAEILFTAGFNGLIPTSIGNGHAVPRDFGFLVERSTLEECNNIAVNPRSDDGDVLDGASQKLVEVATRPAFESLSVWDNSGRMIAEFTANDLLLGPVNLKELVGERLQGTVPGIYFIRLIEDGKLTTQKIFVQ